MSSATTPAERRGDIQGLRALAVTLVVLAHTGWRGAEGGFIGVDVFFVISGFLITGLLLRERDSTGRISIADFYARRARRILPASAVVTVAVLAVIAVDSSVAEAEAARTDAAWSAMFAANIHFALQSVDYWATEIASPFQHYWSLAVEEQFYVVWPVLIGLLAARLGRRGLGILLITIVAASLAYSVWYTATSPLAAYFSTAARVHELGIGALLAFAAPHLRLQPGPRLMLAAGGLATILAAATLLPAAAAFPGALALVPTLGTAAVIAAGCTGPHLGARMLGIAPLRYLGDLSYSLYLWHLPVLVLGPRYLPGAWSSLAQDAVLVTSALLLAILTHHLIERPLMHLRPRNRRQRAGILSFWPTSVALALVAGLLAVNQTTAAVAARDEKAAAYFDARPIESVARAVSIEQQLRDAVALARSGAPIPPGLDFAGNRSDIWFKRYKGVGAWWDKSSVTLRSYGDATASRTVVLLGDSHAGMWLSALDTYGKAHGIRVVPLLKHACSAYAYPQRLGGKAYPACTKFRTWSLARIREIRPEAVVVTSRGYQEVAPRAGQSVASAWRSGVSATVRRLRAITPNVLVLSDLPSRPKDPATCLSGRRSTQRTCLAPIRGREITSNMVTAPAARKAGARYVDVIRLACASKSCPALVGRTFVYFDDDHISVTWGRVIGERFGDLLGL